MRILVVTFFLLTGCATTDIPGVPAETKIPVGIPCLTKDEVPTRPNFVTDTQLAVKDDAQFVFSLANDRLVRQEYEGRLEAVLKGCVSDQPLPESITPPVTLPPNRSWWQFWR